MYQVVFIEKDGHESCCRFSHHSEQEARDEAVSLMRHSYTGEHTVGYYIREI